MSSSSSDEDEQKRSKRHREDDDDDGSRKKKKEKKEKKEKKDKKDKKKKDKDRHKRREVPPSEQISEDDYFRRYPEFKHWLLEAKGCYFDSMQTEDLRKRFQKFVTKWNDGDLSAKYYTGLKDAPSGGATRTAHKWGFASKLSASDQVDLENVRDSMESQTRRDQRAADERMTKVEAQRRAASVCLPCGPAAGGDASGGGSSGPPRTMGPAMGPS